MKSALKTFHQKPIFVKFHTIPLEKDETSAIQYPTISLIQVEYITENFELNIEATQSLNPFGSINLGLTIEELVEPLQSNAKMTDSMLQDYEVFTTNPTLLS